MARAPAATQLALDVSDDVLSISALHRRIGESIARRWREPIWIRGEVRSVFERGGHCFLDLSDPDGPTGRAERATVKARCWESAWSPIKAVLAEQGTTLTAGMVVTLRGRPEVYAPRSEIRFAVSTLDVEALLGRLAAQRALLLRTLAAEGLLERNRQVPLSPVPLRVGLVGSPGTEGAKDFLGQLLTSPYGFDVALSPAVVQGPDAPRAIAAAIDSLRDRERDVIVIVRGGGARADLAAFDTEPVARAIAGSLRPVWSGVGHTGDISVADTVAARAFATPTAAAQELVATVRHYCEDTDAAATRIARRSNEMLARHGERNTLARHRVAAGSAGVLARERDRIRTGAGTLARRAPGAVEDRQQAVSAAAATAAAGARSALGRVAERLDAARRLVRANDVGRQLALGYSLTTDDDGAVVRSVAGLAPGDGLVTRLADGTVRSTVTDTRPAPRRDRQGDAR